MAQGTLTTFEEFNLYIGQNVHELGVDSFSVILIDNTLVPIASQASPDSALYTEIANGNGYTTGGIALTTTWTEIGGLASFKVTNSPSTWTINASGPENIYYALIINTSATATDAVAFIDMTIDGGTTPVSLRDADVVINFDANGILTLS